MGLASRDVLVKRRLRLAQNRTELQPPHGKKWVWLAGVHQVEGMCDWMVPEIELRHTYGNSKVLPAGNLKGRFYGEKRLPK